MINSLKEIELETKTQFEIINITDHVKLALVEFGLKKGIVSVFAPHTTAAIRINHDEPLLKQDIMKMLYRIVPIEANYAHDFFEMRTEARADERSNGHAHIKAFLLGDSECVPVRNGQIVMGERQSIFFVELDGGRKRRVMMQVLGE
ncbi:MAG: secondary thiamine-phosphate synthase enzyme YjbQ [bacterium]|nr:secondary thiamine-phosphate synthase enzyme YjbQ [bacterium]